MQKTYCIKLSNILAKGGKDTEDIFLLYTSPMPDDIDKIAWNLCNCDDTVQAAKFVTLSADFLDVYKIKNGDLQVNAHFNVVGDDAEFIEKVFEAYKDSFLDYVRETLNEYYSRTANRAVFYPKPVDWDVVSK